jgi:hypothetical protein
MFNLALINPTIPQSPFQFIPNIFKS